IGLDVLREVQAHAEDRHSNLLQKKLISPRGHTATAEYSSAASSSVWTSSSAKPLVALARFSAFSAAILISLRASMSNSTKGICTSQAASYKLSMITEKPLGRVAMASAISSALPAAETASE